VVRNAKRKEAGAKVVGAVPPIDIREGGGGLGMGKPAGTPTAVGGQSKERAGGPPPLPVPIATFTI